MDSSRVFTGNASYITNNNEEREQSGSKWKELLDGTWNKWFNTNCRGNISISTKNVPAHLVGNTKRSSSYTKKHQKWNFPTSLYTIKMYYEHIYDEDKIKSCLSFGTTRSMRTYIAQSVAWIIFRSFVFITAVAFISKPNK